MASYVNKNLVDGERVIKRASVSWLSFLPRILIAAFLMMPYFTNPAMQENAFSFAFMLIGAYLFLSAAIYIFTTELALTNKRIIAKFGFISRKTIELRLEKVESLSINQGIFGRLLNFGSVVVNGTGGTSTPIPSIDSPLDFRRVVNNHLEEGEENK